MKKMLTLLIVLFVYSSSFAVVNMAVEQHNLQSSFENLDPMVQQMDMDDFLTMTPKSYRQMTGKKMGFKKALQLKAAQRLIKKANAKNAEAGTDLEITKGVYIVGSIIGLGFLAMGLLDDWSGNNWWINLVLVILGGTLLGFLFSGGLLFYSILAFVHAMLVMGNYF